MIITKKIFVKFNVFLFLIFMSNVFVIASSTENEGVKCIDREREALLKFMAELIDDYGRLSTWGSEEHKKECCKWNGIRCHNRTNHVVSLDLQGPLDENLLPSKTLRGKISPSLLELVDITYLDLSSNDFHTTIPRFIGSFKKLQHLNLSNSNFIGSIPSHLGNLSMLQVLDLRGNSDIYAESLDWLSGFHSLQHLDLSGLDLQKVSTWLKPINKMTQLKRLYLRSCHVQETLLTSSFPDRNESNSLMVLDLHDNNLKISTFLWFLNFSSNYSYIDFSSNNLEGKIPDALTNLMSLSHLDLSYNYDLEGSIPDTLGNMISLAYLDLSRNRLEGNIPVGLGKMMSISYVDLSRNKLQGGFPRSPANLSNLVSLQLCQNKLEGDLTYMNEFLRESRMLVSLDLSNNRFYGSVPPLSRFFSLNTLNLGGNQLNGSFTDRKLRLPYLASLDVSQNRLTGRLPDFASCSSLEYLDLSENKFNGTLTETIAYLSKLRSLSVHLNDLEGVVSETHLFNLSALQLLDLSFNSLLTIRINSDWNPPFQLSALSLANCTIGPSFPKWLQKQTQIEELDISSSQIYDIVPGWFWDSSQMLDSLNMSFNHIYGVIPDVLSNYSFSLLDLRSNEFNGSLPLLSSTFAYIDLSRNKFSGEITEFCKQVYRCTVLDLSNNQLSGGLSKECFMKLVTHENLNLGSNSFSGKIIPSPRSSFCALTSLHLRNNSFTGQLPMSLGDCHSLEILDLGNNYFTGKIPIWIGECLSKVTFVSLRSNEFSGTLPSNLCLLAKIRILDISMNDISGTIPRCLNNFTSMSTRPTSLEYYGLYDSAYVMWKGHDTEYANTLWMLKVIDLSRNSLIGEIPTEITSLEGLIGLNLSRNHLVGSIPRNIDKLEFLNFLDLSENNLSGRIPTTLSEMDHLGVLNLSFNNLSGKIPWSTHSDTFGSNTYLGNPQLCGSPLSRPCPEDQMPQIPKSTIYSDSEDDLDMYITKGFYVSMAIGFILAFWGIFGTLNFNKSCRIKFSKLLMALDDWWYVKIELNKRALQRYFQN